MTALISRAGIIWLGLVVVAVLNGLLREQILLPALGHHVSLPLSGLTLSSLALLFTYFTLPFIGRQSQSIYLAIGLLWVILTLLFEWLFGHYLMGKTWPEISAQFNPLQGNLFLLVLLTTLLAPWLTARLRGFN